MNCYIDSSVVLRHLLGGGPVFSDFRRYRRVGSSELLIIECSRVIDRYRMEKLLDDEQAADARERLRAVTDGMYIIELNGVVKKRAGGQFPTVIGTLDALHISSAIVWMEAEKMKSLALISHDRQMNICARAMGLDVAAMQSHPRKKPSLNGKDPF